MARIPSKQEILDWISDNPDEAGKRDLARAFGLKGPERVELKRLLKEMEADGALARRKRNYRDPTGLPPVAMLRILAPDAAGDLFAVPAEGEGIGDGDSPRIAVVASRSDPALGEGDRILARLTPVGDGYEARLIRKIGTNPLRIVGIYRKGPDGGRILPVDKGSDKEWRVPAEVSQGAEDGELVEAELAGPKVRMGLPRARIVERLGDPSAPRAVSLIAIHQYGIPDHFPDEVMAAADALHAAPLGRREDLRTIPLMTIDPADARDRDDAVFARADPDPANPGGHVIWVAIADVAHYVTPQSALDQEARRRGNSTYFPDRVVPMLPDRLSGDLCSLHENVDRAVLAAEIVIDAQGAKRSHRFTRGLMRSRASLAYEEVQAAHDGAPTDRTAPLMAEGIEPLFAAYRALKMARERRQPLDLDLPERQIILDEAGHVTSVAFKERYDAHKLIEEFMILANVAAAEELVRLRQPLLFRVHEEPSPEKIETLRETAEAAGFTLAKGQVLKTATLNRLLAQSQGTEFDELMNVTMLRSMTQAYYSRENFGHFGLALQNYAHFTSPIRRYADLIVHRSLIAAHGWGKDGLSAADVEMLDETAKLVSECERRSMAAERDTTDRYLAAYLSERVGTELAGHISGVAKFGLFVKLDETGADGLVPIRTIGREYYHFDPARQVLTGADSGRVMHVGQRVTVRLTEAVPVTGGLVLELLDLDDSPLAAPARRPPGKGTGRKPGIAKARASKLRRRVERRGK